MDIYQDLKQAVDFHQAGQLDLAGAAYLRLNQIAPHHPDPLHLMGVIAYQAGEYPTAVELIKRALDIDAGNSAYHNNLGNAYKQMGLHGNAIGCYRRAIELNPEYAEAYFDLGNTFQELGRLHDAISAYRSALKIDPSLAEAHSNLGIAFFKQGQFDEAIVRFETTLQLKPDDVVAQINIGNAFKKKRQFRRAIDWYERALKSNPGSVEAHAQMAHAFQKLGRLTEADSCYQTAVEMDATRYELYNCRGTVQLALGRLEEAVECFQKTLALNPQDPQAYCNLGIVYRKQDLLEDAVSNYRKAIELQPDFISAYYNLGNTYGRLGEVKQAIDCYRKVVQLDPDHTNALSLLIRQLQQICAWEELQEPLEMLNRQTRAVLQQQHKSPEMPFLTVSLSDDPGRCLDVARLWAEGISAKASALTLADSAGTSIESGSASGKKPNRHLKIGYLSADFRNHATAHLMRSLFSYHDRGLFKIYCYSYGRNDHSEYRRQIESDCDRFVELRSLGDFEAARAIRKDEVDILVDLKGYTEGNRLEICAYRPAPIQVSYLGFPGTSGAHFFDYIITDRIVSPPNQARYYTEKLVYMPHCYQINDCHQKISENEFQRQDFGLCDQGFVFCSFNEPYKIEPVMFEVWMDVLQQVPSSVLWLLKKNRLTAMNLQREASRTGIAPDRLIFAEKLPKADHLARLHLADLYLDTRIYNGHTTISDALWAGVPGVTLQGKHFASRVASSVLASAGLPELITGNLSNYQALVIHLATNPAALNSIKAKLSRNRLAAPLFDTPRFARHLEKAYDEMWHIYLKGEKPRKIEVAAN
jgi:protein O-GlcNAc transferase